MTTPRATDKPKPRAMRDAFLEEIWRAMAQDPSIFFVTADFGSPVLDKIRADYPKQFINVGIAEQNLINISAGLALEGHKVFAYAIAPFITMRCFEQIRVSLALLSQVRPMNVNLLGVGAGYSYVVSGPTHQCYEDITLMRGLPSLDVLSPADHVMAAGLFDRCAADCKPKYLRLDAQALPAIYTSAPDLSAGFVELKAGRDVCLVATGYMVHTALAAAEKLAALGISAGVVDLFDLSSCNSTALEAHLCSFKRVVSMEEGFRGRGGMDALLFEMLSQSPTHTRMLNLGVEPRYRFELGSRQELHDLVGIGLQPSVAAIASFVAQAANETTVERTSGHSVESNEPLSPANRRAAL